MINAKVTVSLDFEPLLSMYICLKEYNDFW